MVLRSVGYQSVPLPGVPFDERSSVVPNVEGRVTGPDGSALPGEYVAGWLKRGPTGVIGTNKSDAAQTVRALLADLAGGPGPDDVPLPRAGLLRYPEAAPQAAAEAASSFEELLAARGIQPVSYEDWLRIEAAERELAAALGRGARVKLSSREELDRACGFVRRS
jgi:ferredoxin--NADP+ reductase